MFIHNIYFNTYKIQTDLKYARKDMNYLENQYLKLSKNQLFNSIILKQALKFSEDHRSGLLTHTHTHTQSERERESERDRLTSRP